MNKTSFLVVAVLAGLAGGAFLTGTTLIDTSVLEAVSSDAGTQTLSHSSQSPRSFKAQNDSREYRSERIYETLSKTDLYDIERPGFSSYFLASHFAQSRYDWDAASHYLSKVLETDPDNTDLIRRSMILSMGAGDLETAADRANTLIDLEQAEGLTHLVLIVEALSQNRPARALDHLANMPEGDITGFVHPMLAGWANLAVDETDFKVSEEFKVTTIHMYNGGLMALFAGESDKAAAFAQYIVDLGRISPEDAERAADLFAAAGHYDDALVLYKGTLIQNPSNSSLMDKIKALESDEPIRPLLDHLYVQTPAEGAAIALNDMARILFNERSDSSAVLFVNMALSLNPDFTDGRLILANILARHERYEAAIEHYMAVGKSHDLYMEVQRHIASLLEEAGREKDALEFLNRLFVEYDDIEALIHYGDIQRSKERYGKALVAYNRAADAIGDAIPEQYWHLLYARGMAYEREGQWEKAEADLTAALSYRPDHPYLLNYLGYGWADQGLNLEKSLELIERAVALQPRDGYIRDSLGWVLYMMGRYDEAIPHLEKAVELMPYDATLNDHLGDAYWQVGRRLEARFQWERAINNADDPTLKTAVRDKLDKGLGADDTVKEAKSGITQPPGGAAQ